jgi:rhodanese-related sulfurtransferase
MNRTGDAMLRMFTFLCLLITSSAFAEGQKAYPDEKFFSSNIPVIDIRTPGEWQLTGIVDGSKTLMFFDEQGNHDADRFLRELDAIVDKDKPFAIICRTGRRTGIVATFLDQQGYRVIDLTGGITHMIKIGIPLVPYDPR